MEFAKRAWEKTPYWAKPGLKMGAVLVAFKLGIIALAVAVVMLKKVIALFG